MPEPAAGSSSTRLSRSSIPKTYIRHVIIEPTLRVSPRYHNLLPAFPPPSSRWPPSASVLADMFLLSHPTSPKSVTKHVP